MVVFCTCWLVALVPHSLIGLTRPGQPTGSSLLTEQWSWEESIKASSPFTICGQHTAYLRELLEGLGAQGRKVVHRGGFLLSVVSQGLRRGTTWALLLPPLHRCGAVMSIEPYANGTALDSALLFSWWSTFKIWPNFVENLSTPPKHFKEVTQDFFLSLRVLNSYKGYNSQCILKLDTLK